MAAQEKETAEARAERMLVTSEEQLYFKRISMQAGYFTASAKYLRNCALEFSDAIDLLDRGWIKFVVYLTSCAVLHQYHRDAPNRARGEIYAADRIVAFFRRIVIRNIVSRVWKRTNLMFMSSLSPQSSKTNSPAMALRKQMAQGLGSNSGDTPNSGGSRKRSRPQHQPQQPQQQQKCVSISSDHSLPTTKSEKLVPTKQTTIPERRKPFFIREVVAPSGKTLLVDMSVSIESDELIDANEVNIRVARRQAARYEAWKNIECSAYIETDVTQEPAGISAKQAIADSALYSASAFHSSAAAASSTSTAASANIIPGKGIENPIPRRLIVHLGRKNSMHQEQRKENECIKYCPVKATLTVVEHTAAAPGAGDDATSLGDSSLHSNTFQNSGLSNYKTPNSMLQAAKAAAGHNLQERRQSAAELAWEESGALKAVPMGSSGIHPHGPAGQPVITYHLALDNLLAYSCYSVQFVLDKHLADDIKDGNKSFFRYLSHMDDDDDLSMESESNAEVTFAQVGKQWVIQDNQSTDTEEVALSPLKAHQIDADADADADARLRVELAQYVYTRPAVPRSVKGLTARVAYHSADASYAYSAADQTPIIQYTPAVAAATSEREVMRTLQGGVDVRWLQSVEDAHSHTHYEVQRRLLLINCAQTAPALNLLPASGAGRNLSAKKGRKDRTVNEAVPASTPLAPQSVEELIYVGPWKHVAGLKSSLRNAGRNSAASVASLASAGTMGSTSTAMASSKGGVSHNNNSSNNNLIGGAAGAPDWSFLSASTPHHSTHCTDRVSLPAELDANPDAYNLVMGFLCARFPDLVLQDADSGSQQIGDAQQANAEAGLLLQRVVESGLVVGLEYRVRAINSAGLGKFSACTANLPIFQSSTAQPSYHPSSSSSVTASGVASRQVNGVCTVQLARVFAHLAQLCDFRTKHPKYRSQNNDLVGMVLAQRAETAKAADTQFIERSGDPFVDYLLDLKDGEKGEDATLSGKLAKEKASNKVNEEEMDVISAWIHSLELECPIK